MRIIIDIFNHDYEDLADVLNEIEELKKKNQNEGRIEDIYIDFYPFDFSELYELFYKDDPDNVKKNNQSEGG